MATPMKAIADKCKDCAYDPLGRGNWRQQVENCSITNCPLYPLRPVTGATREARKQARIDAMSPEERAKYDQKVAAARARLHGETHVSQEDQ